MQNKHTRITTPIGVAKWPSLEKPDTKFDKDGCYKVDLIVQGDEADALVKEMSTVRDAHIETIKETKPKWKAKVSPLPVSDEVDDDENPTGAKVFKFKLKAVGINGEDRWEQRPIIMDSDGTPITKVPRIGGGSKLIVCADIIPYLSPMVGAGVSLRLKAVQLIDLVEYSSSSANDWNFTPQKGFKVSDQEVETEEGVEISEESADF